MIFHLPIADHQNRLSKNWTNFLQSISPEISNWKILSIKTFFPEFFTWNQGLSSYIPTKSWIIWPRQLWSKINSIFLIAVDTLLPLKEMYSLLEDLTPNQENSLLSVIILMSIEPYYSQSMTCFTLEPIMWSICTKTTSTYWVGCHTEMTQTGANLSFKVWILVNTILKLLKNGLCCLIFKKLDRHSVFANSMRSIFLSLEENA